MHRQFFSTLRLPLLMAATLMLTGCNIPGLDGDKKAAEAEAEAKAIGGACRHALRGIEDCYEQNPDAVKAAVFAGWKEMDEYMRENKLEGIAPPKPPKEEPSMITEKADKAEAKKPATKPKAAAH